jgi:hypothetical protein
MTPQEVIAQIPSFSVEDRLAILESLTQSLADLLPPPKRGDSAKRLRGLLKLNSELPPDWDWKQAKQDYLLGRHL